jgi:hypothetical protein
MTGARFACGVGVGVGVGLDGELLPQDSEATRHTNARAIQMRRIIFLLGNTAEGSAVEEYD